MAKIEIEENRTESQRLYAAWKFARARWDQAIYDPAHGGDDLPEETGGPLEDADEAALIAYLLHPAQSLNDLSQKLRVFQSEGDGTFARETGVLARLVEDARSLALQSLSAAEHISERPAPAYSAPRRHPAEEAKISEIDGAIDCIEFALDGIIAATEHCEPDVIGPIDAAQRVIRQQIEIARGGTMSLRYGPA